MIRVAFGGDLVTRPGVYEVRRPLGRMGTPYGQYLLDDVTAGRVDAKMFVFLIAGDHVTQGKFSSALAVWLSFLTGWDLHIGGMF